MPFIAACLIAVAATFAGTTAATAQGAQTGAIAGVVTDSATSAGVSSATIVVEQTKFGALADQGGHYRLGGIPAGTYTVVARRIGYTARRQSVTVVAGQETTADFALRVATRSLDQVIITGTVAGEQSRSLGNVVSKISAPDVLERSQSPELGDLLKARAPGVTIAENTGRVGSGPNIQIRGLSSMGLNNTPLLYVDGVRVDNSSATGPTQTAGALGSQNSQVANRLNDINPQDIESIEIIKGPAAATIYGTEAANGVIQIITKKGGAIKPTFGLNVRAGTIYFRDPEGRLPTNYAPDGSGNITTWNGPRSEADSGRSLFTNGSSQMYNLSLSGGASQVQYYLSSTLQDDKGVEANNKGRQYSAHANVNVAATPKLDIGSSLNFVRINNHLGTDGGESSMLGAEIGHINVFPASRGFFPVPPELVTTLFDNTDEANRFTGSVTFAHRPATWFSQRFIAGIDYTGDNGKSLERFASPDLAVFLSPLAATGQIGQTLRQNTTITADYSGTATFKVSPSLSSSTSLGGQFYRTQLDTSYLGGKGFPAPGVEAISATSAPLQSLQDQILNTTVGAYGQEQLAWNDRLFFTAALRVDNNSAFGENFKWITYPKVSASWVVNEEPFWHSSFINTLHVRAAYGESGRAPAVFSALRTYIPIQGPLGSNAITAGAYGNSDLQPERGKELELGFDAQLFKRLELDFTYFNKHTTNEIVKQPLAPSTGFPGTQFANLGQVNNHGIELQATFAAITRTNFSWEIIGNISTAKNKIISVGDLPSLPGIGQNNIAGYPIASYFAKHVISADRDPATGFATNVMCDGGAGNAPVTCDVAPLLYSGSPTPTVTGAIGNSFMIGKRLRLYALVDFRHGNKLYNAVEEIRCAGEIGLGLCDANYHPQKYSTLYLAETDVGLATSGGNDQFIEDASFAKLREISATYALPERFIPGVRTASFTLAARELHTWTHYRGPDPEINYNANAGVAGINFDQGILPPLSRITASLNITF